MATKQSFKDYLTLALITAGAHEGHAKRIVTYLSRNGVTNKTELKKFMKETYIWHPVKDQYFIMRGDKNDMDPYHDHVKGIGIKSYNYLKRIK